MVSVSEAVRIIQSHLFHCGHTEISLENAIGRVLAESVYADRDFPPFDRIMMDGIGIPYQEFLEGCRTFSIQDIQAAGVARKKLNNPNHCMEVMTGAVVPEGIDVVIKYEDIVIKDGVAKIFTDEVSKGQHIHKQGMDVLKGDILLTPGNVLSPAEIALLAAVGKGFVSVRLYPKVAIISTGDELVGVNEVPLPHQIRRSNSYALQAALQRIGIPSEVHHLMDTEEIIYNGLNEILGDADVLILSGGVSKGKFDFVPHALEKLGVQKLFHGVNQRPGKPFWFGRSPEGKTIFALPGNPVSTFMCFYQYIQPWLYASLGVEKKSSTAVLANDFEFGPAVDYFLQVKLKIENGIAMAYPNSGQGSGDFANLGEVDGFLRLSADRNRFYKGDVFEFVGFR